jgi:hypothetical protein
MEGHVIHLNLQEVYILVNTINILPLSWQATLFATLLPQAFKRVANFQLKCSLNPRLFLLDARGILNNYFVHLYVNPLNCITSLLGSLLLLSNIPPLWAPSKTFEG